MLIFGKEKNWINKIYIINRRKLMDSNQVKNKAKLLKELSKKYGYDISHGHSLEIISHLENQVNWHVTVANSDQYIRTGVTELDKVLKGGFRRGGLVSIIGEPNSGKNFFCNSVACNAIRDNKKVLVIQLQGQKNYLLNRFISNFCDIKLFSLVKGELTNKERAKVKHAQKIFEDKLTISNFVMNNPDIDSLYSHLDTMKQIFNYDYDMIYINYATLLGKSLTGINERKRIGDIFRKLSMIARENNCTVLTPVNTTPSQKNIITSDQSPYAFEFCRVSSTVISINWTEEEKKLNQMRLFLEKQLHKEKNKIYGIYTDLDNSNLFKGEFVVLDKPKVL